MRHDPRSDSALPPAHVPRHDALSPTLSLCVVNTYFAPLPAYTRLYFESCRHNPDVRFLFVSDQPRPSELPENVEWVSMTLDALSDRLEQALGFRVYVNASLKVCDARPAFGLAFADELNGYSHWAYSDIDLLWGRILPLLRRYAEGADVLSFREKWLSGTFTVFRNTEQNARLFLQAPDAYDTLTSPDHHDFDESCGRWDRARTASELRRLGLRTSFWDILFQRHAAGETRWVHPELLVEPHPRVESFAFEWNQGTLTEASSGAERIAYHLLNAKESPYFYLPTWKAIPSRLWISEQGISSTPTPTFQFQLVRRARGLPRHAYDVGLRLARRTTRTWHQLARRRLTNQLVSNPSRRPKLTF